MRVEFTEPLPFPVRLDVESTNLCSLSCVMCPRQLMKREQGCMSYETLDKILSEGKGKAETLIFHQMGEPLLHPALFPMIKSIHDSGLWVSISTNAVSLSAGSCLRFANAGLDHITLSLESTDKKSYEKIRVGGNFNLVKDNIETFIRERRELGRGPHIELQIIPMTDNADFVEEFKAKYTKVIKGIGNVYVKEYCVWAGHTPDLRIDIPERNFKCTIPNYNTTIQWNGDVVGCCLDYDGFLKMGNIHEKSLQEIWTGPEYQRFRKAHKSGDLSEFKFCSDCIKKEGYCI